MICPLTNKQCDSTGCGDKIGCGIQNWQNQPNQLQWIPKRNMVIRYSKKFPYAPYLNEDIGFEMTIGEHENPLEKMEELRQMAKQFHKKNNPHLYQEQGTVVVSSQWEEKYHTQEQPTVTTYSTQPIDNQLTQEQKIHNLITQSTSILELEQYKLLSNNKKYPSLKEVWDKQYEKLTNGL